MTTTQVTLLIAINGLVFWQGEKRRFLWVIGAIIDFMTGLIYAATGAQWSLTWDFGFVIAILGLYCLSVFMMWAIGSLKKKSHKSRDEDG